MQDGELGFYSSSLTLDYVIPIRTAAAGPETQNSPGAFASHFWGCKFAPLFLNFGPGGIAPGLAQRAPLLLTDFRVDIGVKRGDTLSPTLFNLIIGNLLTQVGLRGNISTRPKQLMAYADDILILARTEKSLIETFKQLKESSMEVGLKINEEKTKYLKCSKKDTNNSPLNKCTNANTWEPI